MTPRMRVLTTGVAALLVAAALVLGVREIGGDDGTKVVAEFTSAAPLVEGNQVKVDGVVVGTVKKLAVRKGHAEVTMSLDRAAMPLHDDATFTIRPVSLLGERYVDIDRGTAGAPTLDLSARVPVSRTASNVGLDDVLNTFDDPTGKGMGALVTTLGSGLRGNGKKADAALTSLAPSMRETEKMAAVLAQHNELLGSLIENVEPVAKALATDDGKAMDKIVDSADELLAASSAQQEDLDKTLQRLPKTLASARSTLDHLSGTAEQTTPTLEGMRPLTDRLPQISKELTAMSDALDPALATSRPVLERAQKLLDVATPAADDMRKGGPDLATAVGSTRPVVSKVTANRENLFNFIRYWALTTNGHDGLSHYFRVNASINTAMLTGLVPVSKPKASSQPEAAPSTQKPLAGLLDFSGTSDGPTGLEKKQEKSLLGFLFGGN
ncbi:MCE family protein [Aeromicrobium terrae]|uniref:MCE family protein n=1 Tax=Aeromicrobium terrae TaxID=2498846 RepID=A0A5C8NJT7_9ACTN|nr:MCE family protein [Aeromicrobium terrae]